jgi:undecaprenyl-phosphate galactose phosphotransferase
MEHGKTLISRISYPCANSHPGAVSAAVCMLALVASDALALAFAAGAFGYLRAWPDAETLEHFDFRMVAILAANLLAMLRFASLRHYTWRKPMLRELREVLGALALAGGCELALLTLHGDVGYLSFAAFAWLHAAILVPLGRLIIKLVLLKLRLWQRDLFVVGSGRLALDVATAIQSEPLTGLRIRAFVPEGENRLPLGARTAALHPQDAALLAGSVVMVALEPDQAALRSAWLRALGSSHAANVVLVKSVAGMPLHGMAATYVKSHDVLLLQVRDNLNRWHVRFFKRCLDVTGALLASLMLSPLLCYLAWQVGRDGGSAIYGHPRIGKDGRPFKCYKFRSMVVDAGAVLAELLERDPQARREWERDFKLKNDPRVTRIGAFLRRTSLDELPQLWNVLCGDMSLVGPRPIVQDELARYGDDVCYYLMARPGMTGLWQVSGRNDADYVRRVYLDAWYVRNWSLWYDIAILFKTVRVVLKRDGAY